MVKFSKMIETNNKVKTRTAEQARGQKSGFYK